MGIEAIEVGSRTIPIWLGLGKVVGRGCGDRSRLGASRKTDEHIHLRNLEINVGRQVATVPLKIMIDASPGPLRQQPGVIAVVPQVPHG